MNANSTTVTMSKQYYHGNSTSRYQNNIIMANSTTVTLSKQYYHDQCVSLRQKYRSDNAKISSWHRNNISRDRNVLMLRHRVLKWLYISDDIETNSIGYRAHIADTSNPSQFREIVVTTSLRYCLCRCEIVTIFQ